jgi:hypothetical protein
MALPRFIQRRVHTRCKLADQEIRAQRKGEIIVGSQET